MVQQLFTYCLNVKIMKSNSKNNTIVAAAATLLCCKLANRWEFLEKEEPKMNTQSCGDEQSAPIGLLKPTFGVVVTISKKNAVNCSAFLFSRPIRFICMLLDRFDNNIVFLLLNKHIKFSDYVSTYEIPSIDRM